MRTVPGFATGKWQDLWKEKTPEPLVALWPLQASRNTSQKQDTKQEQTGKDLEMALTPLMYMKYAAAQLVTLRTADVGWH